MVKTSIRIGLLIGVSSIVWAPAFAQTAAAPANPTGVSFSSTAVDVTGALAAQRSIGTAASTDLASLQAMIPALQARATIAELEQRIAKANSDAGRGVLPPSMLASPTPTPSSSQPPTPAAALPSRSTRSESAGESMTITSITGFDGVYQAVINVGDSISQQFPGRQ